MQNKTETVNVSSHYDSDNKQFMNTPDNFYGGKIMDFTRHWKALTSDEWILDIVKGYKIEFDQLPVQQSLPQPINFNSEETEIIRGEIQKLYNKKVIEETLPQFDNYFSNIFIRPKPDGTHRLILNLKQLNEDIEHVHFKMETLRSVLPLIKQDCWFGSIDLKTHIIV